MYSAIGEIIEQFGKVILIPMYLSLTGIAFTTLRKFVRPAIAVSVTAVFVAMPTLVQHAGTAVAELPLLMFLLTALHFLSKWLLVGTRRDLLGFTAFAAFAAFTKNEGLALIPLLLLVVLIAAVAVKSRARITDFLIATISIVIILLPWLIYRAHLPHTHEDYGSKLTRISSIVENLPG